MLSWWRPRKVRQQQVIRDVDNLMGAGDPLPALFLCGGYRAGRVMIAGHWKVEDGLPVGIDVERLRHDHSQAARRLHAALN
jgi:8-oxoguanine deaminase